MPSPDPAPPTPSKPAGAGAEKSEKVWTDPLTPKKKVDWQKIREEADIRQPPGEITPNMAEPWAIVFKEFRQLPKTRAEGMIMMNIMSHAGPRNPTPEQIRDNPSAGWCSCSLATLALESHCHPVYLRFSLNILIRRGLVECKFRSKKGKQNWYRMCDKRTWLRDRQPTDIGIALPYEETAGEARATILLETTLQLWPDCPVALCKARIAEDPAKYRKCLGALKERIKRGSTDPRYQADRLKPVDSLKAYWEWLWENTS